MNRVFALLCGDRGENSIMQTISISVSAILIVAGTFTAPSLITTSRMAAAESNMGIIAIAQSSYLAKKGTYTNKLSELKTGFAGNQINLSACGDAPSLDECSDINIITKIDTDFSSCYVIYHNLDGQTVFFSQSKTFKGDPIIQIPASPWPSIPTAYKTGSDMSNPANKLSSFQGDYDSTCTSWPTSLNQAMTK